VSIPLIPNSFPKKSEILARKAEDRYKVTESDKWVVDLK
jgi:hypothetical protein